ncbi:MAG: folylpolyglutamate synthase/dihydrofolate synthase family protein [Armatimonadaceae bacterium]
MTYEEAVEYMSGLRETGRVGARTNRDRFQALMERLGNPHRKMRCVHVAGTNGKGSTVALITSVLRQAGYRTGTYLSPHVFDLRERVQVDGSPIPREDFTRQVAAIRPHIEALAETPYGQTPEFELKTAVAFRYFAEVGVDVAVIEVGIGGRLDATNVIPPPLVAVITQIGWDHMHLLGDTLGKIAAEKAGIFKTGTLGVTGEPPGEALDVIRQAAAERGVPLNETREAGAPDEADALAVYTRHRDGTVTIRLPSVILAELRLTLRGAFQAANTATAAAAAEVLRRERGLTISDDALRAGLEQAFLPGRFQILRPQPDGPTLVLDAAHNADGAKILADALRNEWGAQKRYTFVFGSSKGHPPGSFLEVIAPLAKRVVATAPTFRPTPAEETAQAAQQAGLPVNLVSSVADAIRQTFAVGSSDDVIVVTGSFYVVGGTPEELRGKV